MYTFKDILKKAFSEGWISYDQIGESTIIVALIFAGFISLYLFFVYRLITKKGFYSKTFNISLFGIALITAAIILTIQSNLIVSLGMVGALSIVRFRTAVKDPMDLMFLFWAIGIGIMCGAGHAEIAVILSIGMTLGIICLNAIPDARAPMLLVVTCSELPAEGNVNETLEKCCKYYKVKARNIKPGRVELTYEVRTKDGGILVQNLSNLEKVSSVSLLAHDGEVTF